MLKFEQEKYLFELGFEVRYQHHSYQFLSLSVRIIIESEDDVTGGFDPDVLTIRVARRNSAFDGVLCEKGKCLSGVFSK